MQNGSSLPPDLPGVLLVAFTILLLSCASPLKSYYKAAANAPYDVIIVPGIPYQDQDWESNIMKSRVLWACYLYKKGITRNVIFSGNAVYSPYREGKIMALYAVALGVPGEHVFSELKAEHSTENLVYSYRMAKSMGFQKIAAATDPFQSNSLKSFAWDYHMHVTFIPILYDSLNTLHVNSSIHIDPSEAYVRNFISLPQRENILKRIIGTLGLNIQN
jgi:uncharacterized SAM-binding protein YcdF (DUF218 family)